MKITLDKSNKYNETILELSKLIRGTIWENNVFLVGGAVRDLIMGKKIKDIDLCVTKLNGGIKFAEWVCLETGNYKQDSNPCVFEKYGTAKFNLRNMTSISDIDIECVHTRKEWYTDSESRNPITEYGTLEEDSIRRDLTINALYLNISTLEVIDPTGKGIDDIMNQRLRTPSEPKQVYKDDPLRMMRAIRFSAKLGWGIDKDTWIGIVTNAKRIKIISQERITDEINKILMTNNPSYGIRKLYHSGLLKIVLTPIYNLIGVKQNKYHFGDVFEHTMATVEKTKPILVNRLAALFHDCAKPYCYSYDNDGVVHFYEHEKHGALITGAFMRKMKYSNAETTKVCVAIRNHMRFKSSGNNCPSNKAIRKFIADVKEENIGITLDLIDADNKSHAKEFCLNDQVALIINKINELKKKENVSEIKLPINGKDIMEKFKLKPSPLIGVYLDAIKEQYLENPNITKDECFNIINKMFIAK